MAYDKSADKVLYMANIDGENDTTLKVSVYSYNGGEPKLQIGPRVYQKRNGEDGFRKAGRLTGGEVEKLADLMPVVHSYLAGGSLDEIV
jgi:hypothetical protein